MKKRHLLLIIGTIPLVLISVFIVLKTGITYGSQQYNPVDEKKTLSEPPLQEKVNYDEIKFENGDVIFRRGISLESQAIIAFDGENGFSHVGLIRIKNSQIEVIHASYGEDGQTGESIISESIEQFLKPLSSNFAEVYRFNGANKSITVSALKQAEIFLEKKTPFDKDFNLDSENKIYCTELVWRAYKEAGIDLTGGKFDRIPYLYVNPDKKFILPSSLLKSNHLQKVWVFR